MCDYPNPSHRSAERDSTERSPNVSRRIPKSLSQSGRGTLINLASLLLPWEKGLEDVACFPQGGLTLVAPQIIFMSNTGNQLNQSEFRGQLEWICEQSILPMWNGRAMP